MIVMINRNTYLDLSENHIFLLTTDDQYHKIFQNTLSRQRNNVLKKQPEQTLIAVQKHK